MWWSLRFSCDFGNTNWHTSWVVWSTCEYALTRSHVSLCGVACSFSALTGFVPLSQSTPFKTQSNLSWLDWIPHCLLSLSHLGTFDPFAPLVLIAANYQEFLGKSHIVNVPWVFNTLWYVIKAWIEPRWARNTRYLYHAYVLGRTFFTAFSSIMINLGFPAFLIMIASSPPSLGLFLFVLKNFHVALKVHHLIMMHHCNGAGNDIHNCMHVRTFNSLITFFSFSLQHVA